ncbi:hypothetical protein Tco_0875797 [Tanacetum coccineum]|uniref:Integrase, catalytic region, zinc finger, CCHC-type, peptidase aspartic, catalytic n=1 Tax=Tanacetum coccineum TaxID=301880 RepID=A0ABQ5BQG6_9ASTR
MSRMQEDIQYAGSDTRPPMLDRTDFESWQQRIRLYCLGKDNGENIMKSIKEGPFQMGTVSDVITGGTEGAVQQGPVRARVLNDLSAEEKERYKADIRATNILLQGIPKDIYSLINHYTDAKDIWENVKMILEGSELTKDDRESQLYDEYEHFRQIKGEGIQGYYEQSYGASTGNCFWFHDVVEDTMRLIKEAPFQRNNARGNGGKGYSVDDDVDDSHENDLALNVDHIFEADECDAFDSDVDEGPTSQTMFMASLTSEDPIYDEAGPSYDSNDPFEVQDHDAFVDHMDEYHEVHEMQNDVQHNYVVDSDADYTSDSNIIPYDQYVEDNAEHVVQCNASSVRNDALMSILDEMHEQGVQSRLTNKPDMVMNDSVTSELARYKELVGEYEKRAKFELTDRERKIDEQRRKMKTYSRILCIVKLNRGLKESNFDKLYAYLKQHEVHANENRMMMERFSQPTNDPLALVSNASNQKYPTQSSESPQSSNQPSLVDNFQLDSGSTSTDNLIESLTNTLTLLTQSYKSHLPQTNNQLRTSSNARNKATVQDDRVVVQDVRADQCDAFDSDVDEGPTTQTMFMANLTSEEAGASYDSNIPSEVQDHDTFVDHMDEYHEVHEMQSDVQHNYVVDSDADYTSDSNIIPYDQYVEDNEEHVVQSNVSSVRNDALMSILDEMHEQGVQSRSANKQVKVVNDTLTSELARYKELVGVYEQRAKFELTDRERKIDEQMRIIISDRNRKETSLKSELHSAQLQLRSTLNHHKIVREEAIILKKDFKQKEDKFLEEFLDIKRLKEKVEDRLYKQDQSVQTVHMICKPKSFYDEKNKVAIGYKNPLCLTRVKQVQPALYNGHVLVMSNHARPVVHDSEDTRDMAEITRKRMMEKMQSPLYENDRKKAETSVPKPLSALTVYPPNTPVKLVPRVLPTKSQVKINLYVLTQLFTEFEKTCKKRITPTGVTEGERGFEQTKRCYLTEVIPFFKTLKEHFAGVQTALFKEVKVMEEIFDQMNDEVDQNTVDKQCAEIVKKNLLIENENLIANCLSNQLLYDVEKSRCLDLEAEMSKVHNESKHISKLEREYLNLQLKYQHLQESFDNNKSQTSQEAPDFNSFFKIKNLEHQIQEKDNVIRDLKVLVSNVNDRSCEPYNANDVTDLLEQNERFRAEIEKVKQHYKELFESIKITRASTNEQTSSLKKAETSVPKPLSALTVYPPNTPVKLVPRVLPTKSQVKINLYVLTQLFTEFDKTCKKRITPTGVTEGERGFEQTKRCYLTEVIPFFKTLKEHFAGVQTALFKEVKVMEEIFDQMNDEVDQNTVDKQCAEIERKNLLIANENLIANCLSNQLMFAVEQSRCLDLEAEMSKVHNESKHISKLEREYLNLQLKYQHLQESFDNNKSQTSQEAPDFNSFFKIKNLEHQIQEKDNVIRDLKVLVSNVNDRSCETYNAKDVTALIEQNECVRVELEKVKQHYKELYDSIKITRVHTREKTSTMLNEIESLKAQLKSKVSREADLETKRQTV